MPRKQDMSWDGTGRRWVKMIFGRRLVVSCRQLKAAGYLSLGAAESKEESVAAANRWLSDQLDNRQFSRHGDEIRHIEARIKYCEQQGWDGYAAGYRGMIQTIQHADDLHPSIIQEMISPGSDVWRERLRSQKGEVSTSNKGIAFWVSRYLELRKAEVEAGHLSHSAYKSSRVCLESFRDWHKGSVETITSQRWSEWYLEIVGRKLSYDHSKKLMSYARSLCMWLIEQGVVKPFEALHSHRYRFTNNREEVEPLPVEEVRQIISTSEDETRLFALMALNVGMTQVDISSLTPGEYDGERINRRRSKSRKQRVRKCSWLLWGETRDLLERYRQEEGERLLLTSRGTPWVTPKKDTIGWLWRQTHETTFTRLRQTSGDYINQQFGKDVADHFLGHHGNPVDRAYFSRQQQKLDEAVTWLESFYDLQPAS